MQCISNCFTLQQLPAKHTLHIVYQQDSNTKLVIDNFFINNPLDQSIILKMLAAYITDISCNQLGVLEDRLVYYDQITFVHKHICRIIVLFYLCRTNFNLIHATPADRHIGEYTPYIVLRTDIKEWIQKYPHCTLTYH